MGSSFAATSMPLLMYFLALISANLAVINFMPLPIFDGGLFVFLLIEKIKGRPISLRVQVVTQVIGLVLIVGIFLYVTAQDLMKVYESLSSKLVVERKETEISGLFAALGALLAVLSAGLSVWWFGRVA